MSQSGLGAIALVAPESVVKFCAGAGSAAPIWVVRFLGARLVGQGSFLLIRPTDEVLRLGYSVDALHGVSMLLTVLVKPNYRRSALVAASLAAASVAIGVSLRS
jgi:hypothetical protein